MGGKAGLTTRPISSTGDRARGDRGFALYELVLALAILGLVAGVVFPRVARVPGPAELRQKSLEIAALLRTDRNNAFRRGQEVLSRIDVGEGVVASGSGTRRVEFPRGVKAEFVQSSRELRADGGGIRFRPDGRSSGGVLYLSRQGAVYEISVNWLTSGVAVVPAARPDRAAAGG
ncbi:MAG: prepilin-type N-terminal cleavage/methylation domain-containing protein [Rhizobiales bacterium]|nr:prepilin-type N-terminal cleavage/methylation domain-containing protein [Hyphomicrobiales bacterium]